MVRTNAKTAHDLIRRPVITEKSTVQRLGNNKYAFAVPAGANKSEIKRAVESVFKVKVLGVNTMIQHGKARRGRSWNIGRQPDWKKAIVTLKEGDKISFFEGL